jgi:hypothetical protein
LDALTELSTTLIKPTDTPIEICRNPKLFPFFFKDAIEALDGCHIPITVKAQDAGKY